MDEGTKISDKTLLAKMSELGFRFKQKQKHDGKYVHKVTWKYGDVAPASATRVIDGEPVKLTRTMALLELKELQLQALHEVRDAPRAWVVNDVITRNAINKPTGKIPDHGLGEDPMVSKLILQTINYVGQKILKMY